MRQFFLIPLFLVSACGGEESQNAAELSEVADQPVNTAAPAADQQSNEAQGPTEPPAPATTAVTVGPLTAPYDAALLAPVAAEIPVPPDWATKAKGQKLLARDRAQLIGKAECMYGQSGEASRCNAGQEAGLAFAELDRKFEEIGRTVPADQRKSITLAGAKGLSWEIGAEGEGAEYILLPAGNRTIMIVRQFRNTGNPDQGAVGRVLGNLRLNGE